MHIGLTVSSYLSRVLAHPPPANETLTVWRKALSSRIGHEELRASTARVRLSVPGASASTLLGSPVSIHVERVASSVVIAPALTLSSAPADLRFIEYPELLITSALCDPLQRFEAVGVDGVHRFVRLHGAGQFVRIADVVREVDTKNVGFVLCPRERNFVNVFHREILLSAVNETLPVMSIAGPGDVIAARAWIDEGAPQSIIERNLLVMLIAAAYVRVW